MMGPGKTCFFQRTRKKKKIREFSEMFQRAAFGAGCFWGTEKFFREQFGQRLTTIGVGYMGGATPNPRYGDVCSGSTGHAEVVHMEYKESKVTYEQLVEFFYRMHDPTMKKGSQYRSTIFYFDARQLEVAKRLEGKVSGGQNVTTLEAAGEYFRAEEYHQNYLGKF